MHLLLVPKNEMQPLGPIHNACFLLDLILCGKWQSKINDKRKVHQIKIKIKMKRNSDHNTFKTKRPVPCPPCCPSSSFMLDLYPLSIFELKLSCIFFLLFLIYLFLQIHNTDYSILQSHNFDSSLILFNTCYDIF